MIECLPVEWAARTGRARSQWQGGLSVCHIEGGKADKHIDCSFAAEAARI